MCIRDSTHTHTHTLVHKCSALQQSAAYKTSIGVARYYSFAHVVPEVSAINIYTLTSETLIQLKKAVPISACTITVGPLFCSKRTNEADPSCRRHSAVRITFTENNGYPMVNGRQIASDGLATTFIKITN